MLVSTLAVSLSLANPNAAMPIAGDTALSGTVLTLSYADPDQTNPAQPAPPADPAPVPPASMPATVPAAPPPGSATQPPKDQIIVTGEVEPTKADPAMAINQASYDVVQKVDGAIVAPLAMGYKNALPSPVRTALRNFLINLTEPVVFVNYLLQGKPGKAAETLGRFAINSTVGVGGLIDVAKRKPFNLPHRNNGFANTMGYYGIGPGPYLFLPLVGPTTVRDLLGLGLDRAFLPAVVGAPLNDPAYVLGSGTIKSLDDRVQLDCELRQQAASSNPYNTAREYYLDRRKADIEALHGRSYTPKGYGLIDVSSQCSLDSQRAQIPVNNPNDLPDTAPAEPAPDAAAPAPVADQPTPPRIVLPVFEPALAEPAPAN